MNEQDSQKASSFHVVSSGNDMENCVGNFGHEFVRKMEEIKSIIKFLAQQRTALRVGAPVKMGWSYILGAFDWTIRIYTVS